MPRNIVHILDIGSKSVKALAAERKSDTGIHILGAAAVPAEGVRRGMVSNPDLLAKKIRMAVSEVERFSGIPFKEAYLTFGTPALGASKVRARVAVAQASGEVGTYDVERVMAQARPSSRDLQNREILDTFGLNYSVDSEMIMRDPLGMKGENLEAEVLFVTSLLKPLREMVSVVEEVGVAINDVIPAPLASARAILTPRRPAASKTTCSRPLASSSRDSARPELWRLILERRRLISRLWKKIFLFRLRYFLLAAPILRTISRLDFR